MPDSSRGLLNFENLTHKNIFTHAYNLGRKSLGGGGDGQWSPRSDGSFNFEKQ